MNWKVLLEQYGVVTNGTSQIRLTQPNGNEIIGTIATTTLDDTILLYDIDQDTIPANTLTGVKKIINPLTFAPGTPSNGDRYLIIDQIGDSTATVQSSTWGSLVASVGDIIEYSSAESRWRKVFDASDPDCGSDKEKDPNLSPLASEMRYFVLICSLPYLFNK